MIVAISLLSVGLLLLWKGADFLVSGAVGLADRAGVSQLVIGLTIVAMGTSAPEVAASIAAAISGKGDIAIGNVYGSNIANLALVGGTIALIRPLRVQAQTLRREIPAMLGVALLLWPALRDLGLSRRDGLFFAVVFVGLIAYTILRARAPGDNARAEEAHVTVTPARTATRDVLLVGLGLAALAGGARMAVQGAVAIGGALGLSDGVIGSTIVAIGTSLPELMTCSVAAMRGHHDISVGNLVGSNIFNTLFVTGVAALVHPFSVGPRFAGGCDYWIMIAVSAGFAGVILLGRRVINRPVGGALLAVYAGYLVYLLGFTRTA